MRIAIRRVSSPRRCEPLLPREPAERLVAVEADSPRARRLQPCAQLVRVVVDVVQPDAVAGQIAELLRSQLPWGKARVSEMAVEAVRRVSVVLAASQRLASGLGADEDDV